MSAAEHLVATLLETDEVDPKEYAQQTMQPTQRMADSLRDELTERGWRNIRIEPWDDPGTFVVYAGLIDSAHRAKWYSYRARVAPGAEEGPAFRMTLVRQFKAAAKRAKLQVDDVEIDELRQAHQGYDMATEYEDFEDDPGDWNVTLTFRSNAQPGFWSRDVIGYEGRKPQPPIKPERRPANYYADKMRGIADD